ncbi:unnamed protein product [Didymodactylos carnosus]|uniref:Uncharacterized protein n=1 Tax=Didymodactylos carnosus TaxID=1234261 RepID=A0A813YJP5_9BILA|nr:unnamed protein product [Didymodactylos carnosus]CAF3670705.1 unnamed protein product [Didymodactylos carnosus]
MASASDSDEQLPFSWDKICKIIESGELGRLMRYPDDTVRYSAWCDNIITLYSGMEKYLLEQRLGWHLPIKPLSSILFENSDDYQILLNDFPYAFDENIIHFVLWTKVPFGQDKNGYLDESTAKLIQEFINKKFVTHFGQENVRWFKNYNSASSIPTISHFHILIYDRNRQYSSLKDDILTKINF